MNQTWKNISDEQVVNILLYGSENFTFSTSAKNLSNTIKFLKVTKRFDSLL